MHYANRMVFLSGPKRGVRLLTMGFLKRKPTLTNFLVSGLGKVAANYFRNNRNRSFLP